MRFTVRMLGLVKHSIGGKNKKDVCDQILEVCDKEKGQELHQINH